METHMIFCLSQGLPGFPRTEPKKKQTWQFQGEKQQQQKYRLRNNWPKLERESGPDCNHHFIACLPIPTALHPASLPALHGFTSRLLDARVADQTFTGQSVREPAASPTARLASSALGSDEAKKQPRNCRALTCPWVNTAFRLPNLLRFVHTGRSFSLKINAILY